MTSDEPLDKSQNNTTIENPKVPMQVFDYSLNEILVERNEASKR